MRWSYHRRRSRRIARRTSRERAVLLQERVRHVNRIKGLLANQGITDYEPLHKDRRARLAALKTGDGQPLPLRLKAELLREIELIELLIRQIAEVEVERDIAAELDVEGNQSPVALLARLKTIGPQIAAVLYLEGLYRSFANRREVAAYAGLVPTPWRSGTIDREQGISKAGNRRLRHMMIELAWLWVRHQPDSALSRWVPGTGWHRAWADTADRHCRARTQVADRALALRDARGSAGGRGVESGVTATHDVTTLSHSRAKLTLAPTSAGGPHNVLAARCRDKDWFALPSPTSSMRNFGASRDERRPDVRFCGLGAAVEERARADWCGVNAMIRRPAEHVA